eukprot:5214974-Amphidinium_carterae.1
MMKRIKEGVLQNWEGIGDHICSRQVVSRACLGCTWMRGFHRCFASLGFSVKLALIVQVLWVNSVFAVMRKWRASLTLCSGVPTGIRNVARSSYGRTIRLCHRVLICMGCCLLRKCPVIPHESALAYRTGVHSVWTNGFGRHSNDPHHRCCGVRHHKDIQERTCLPLLGIKQS